MIKKIVKVFVKDSENVENQTVREKYGILGGILGVICNIFLFAVKITNGLILHSLAVMSDAFNNLSDTFSSLISIISAKLSNKKPDKEHPYGHGRLEYIATMIVSFIIILVGVQLLITSGTKIYEGLFQNKVEALQFNWISIVILSCSLLVKIWMFSYNRYLGKKINSSVLQAASTDSLSDVLTTSIVIISTIIGYLWLKDYYYLLDGGMGIIVAFIICLNGIKLVLKTINELLGVPASKEEIKQIESFLLSDPHILGTHDLLVHDYGPGRKFATVHCEVDDRQDVRIAHEIIDALENKAENILNMQLVIHMDPICTTSPTINRINDVISSYIKRTDPDLSHHDLRITEGEENINVIFDLVIPFSYQKDDIVRTINELSKEIKNEDRRFNCVIKLDYH